MSSSIGRALLRDERAGKLVGALSLGDHDLYDSQPVGWARRADPTVSELDGGRARVVELLRSRCLWFQRGDTLRPTTLKRLCGQKERGSTQEQLCEESESGHTTTTSNSFVGARLLISPLQIGGGGGGNAYINYIYISSRCRLAWRR